ncbi:MAG: CopG family ribbon-helix-helix protein [Methanobacterium sp.]|uniref:CopG family ribbon-helix-helix protein n=1 Tax=Methanobacterium sp. TaxID=2164 RepID=UPI003D66066C|nr:CopG family ribbon-helix-helix protein [Methanobacterium sp.]
MPIISISLNEKLLEEIDKIKDEIGFSGRSDVIRASARLLIFDNKEKEELEGEINSILVLIHKQEAEDKVTEIKHDFEDIINTQIHSHLKDNACLELFILEGDANRTKKLSKKFQTSRKIDYVKLIVV